MKFRPIFSFVLIVIITSCGRSNQEKNIEQKLKEMKLREQQLLSWEQRLKSKEDSLMQRELLIDSTDRQFDSAVHFNPAVTGNWSVRMLCIQTNCEGSAIGDTKTEQWNISYKDNLLVVRASTNNKLTRVYEGVHADNGIQLLAKPQSTGTVIKVNLRTTKENRMEGIREIIQGDQCKIIYSLELEKV